MNYKLMMKRDLAEARRRIQVTGSSVKPLEWLWQMAYIHGLATGRSEMILARVHGERRQLKLNFKTKRRKS